MPFPRMSKTFSCHVFTRRTQCALATPSKMSREHVISFCNLIGTCQTKAPEVDSFFRGCYQALSSPTFFEERAWGRGYLSLALGLQHAYLCIILTVLTKFHLYTFIYLTASSKLFMSANG